jgi:hypothetical protein
MAIGLAGIKEEGVAGVRGRGEPCLLSGARVVPAGARHGVVSTRMAASCLRPRRLGGGLTCCCYYRQDVILFLG